MRLSFAALLLSLCSGSAVFAETSLVLNKTGVAASLDTQAITVPLGERVVLSIPVLSGNVWFKDGHPIPGANGRVFIIESATANDTGRYRVGYAGIHSMDSQAVMLNVVDNGAGAKNQKLLAFTSRGLAGSGSQALVTGFVVGENADEPDSAKRVLVRAVGPTLEELGMTDVLRLPQLTVYNSAGEPCLPLTADPLELSKAQLATGAYPLRDGAGDAWQILRLKPGSYAAQVTSGGAAPGFVIVEIYDLP